MSRGCGFGDGSRWVWLAGLLALGCSAEDSARSGALASSDAVGSGAAGDATAADGDGNASQGSTLGASGTTSASGAGGSSSTDGEGLTVAEACGGSRARAEFAPVNMLVMFDRSGSMEDAQKWPKATTALTSFVESPAAEGLRVALRFFPHDTPASGCNDAACSAEACAEPLVNLGQLTGESAPSDAQEELLVSAIAGATTGGGGGGGRGGRGGGQGTPIYAALDGALRWGAQQKSSFPDEETLVIFVTDGEPNGCDEDFGSISALAADALASDGVLTYAIGLEGSSEALLNQLAQAGGTDAGIFIGNNNAEEELLAALDNIRGQSLSCDFPLPQPDDPSMPVDPSRINVTFTPSQGSAGTFPQVATEADCASNNAWYYDVPSAPTRIHLCPESCALVQADPGAQVDILIGCETCGGLDVECEDSTPGDPETSDLPPLL